MCRNATSEPSSWSRRCRPLPDLLHTRLRHLYPIRYSLELLLLLFVPLSSCLFILLSLLGRFSPDVCFCDVTYSPAMVISQLLQTYLRGQSLRREEKMISNFYYIHSIVFCKIAPSSDSASLCIVKKISIALRTTLQASQQCLIDVRCVSSSSRPSGVAILSN